MCLGPDLPMSLNCVSESQCKLWLSRGSEEWLLPVTFGCLSQPGVALIVWSAQKKTILFAICRLVGSHSWRKTMLNAMVHSQKQMVYQDFTKCLCCYFCLCPMPLCPRPKKKKKILILRVIRKSIHGIAKELFQSQLKHWVLKPYKAPVGPNPDYTYLQLWRKNLTHMSRIQRNFPPPQPLPTPPPPPNDIQ